MSKRSILLICVGVFLFGAVAFQIPTINSRIIWRYEVGRTYIKNIFHPIGNAPTAIPLPIGTKTPPSPTPNVTATNQLVTAPISLTPTHSLPPAQAFLSSHPYEKQTPNNCGPAALSMMLHLFGSTGSQGDISEVIKPANGDRNVNPEKMAYWVRNFAG